MGFGMNSLFIVCLLASIYSSNGCTMEGVVWVVPISVRIEDYHEGVFFQRTYSGIGGCTLVSSTDLFGGPYFSTSMDNSIFTLSTTDAYRLYEENETAELVTLSFTCSCTAGAQAAVPLTIQIEINDNNNNIPLFKTPDTPASEDTTYEFTIAPPVPPGFLVTDCISDIIVRDIDLTTYSIDFGVEPNPYFEIAYDGSTADKEFKAVLRTTSFIRSIPEPIVLTISATDVDRTGDPPITTTTTVTIHGSSEFELPLEPVFSQAFYLAQYTEDNQVTLDQPISLQQGYDEQVQFTLEGDHAEDHFAITMDGNQVSLSVTNALSTETLQKGQIYLIVNAAREYTSGASATVVVQLPEVVSLEFERPHYEGVIVDNTLQLTQLILSQGYQGSTVTAVVEDYSSFFTASVVGNLITLSMAPLDDNIIQENNFINLRVTASTDSSSATTIVTLEIVKDDATTPVFGESLYEGTYDTVSGLTIAPILLVQGYDETVTVSFSGEHESYFELVRDGASSTLRVIEESLPSHILSETHLLLSVEATKPRTVGAAAVVSITLPGARELQFEAQSYKGSLQDNILTLETINLNVGYDEDVTFSLSGDYSTSFVVSNVQNQVTITLPTQLPQEVISENNFLMFTLIASSTNALPATTAVLLEIIKDDGTTPVFSQAIYYGNHLGSLDIDIGNMNLLQGYDDSVTFRIAGENSEYFDLIQNQNSATLSVRSSIPEEVIFNEKVFVFNIFADKPLTVGANAAISIKFSEDLIEPTVMQFGNNAYTGILENNVLTLDSVVLETGFAEGTQFLLSGDFVSYFTHTAASNIVSLSMTSELPAEVLENKKFIVLQLEARRERAVSAFTSIIIEIVKEEIVIPVFEQAYYTGLYTEENTLQFLETISLLQGYDETVTFGLEGESAAWFDVTQNGNTASIVSTSPVPQDILDSHHQLLFTVVAYKPNSINGHAAISIDLPNEVLEQEVLRFTQSSYEGQLDGSELQIPTITLSNEITENVLVSVSGAYGTYFTATLDTNVVHVELTTDLPAEVISNNEFIVIDIIASKPDAISGYTALVLSIVKEPPISTPVFEQAYYTGEISEQGGLVFDHTIQLIQGFDESVSFTLDGDGSERFILTQTGQNSLSLSLAEGGMEQIDDFSHLVFSVVASKIGSVSGEAAIVIHNTEEHLEQEILRFSQSSYEGQLDGSQLQIPTITLSNEITENVLVSLSGAYSTYFTATLNANIVNIELITDLPDEVISNNEFIVVNIIASKPDAISGYTALVLSIVKESPISTPVFEQAYYTGEISEQDVLVFDYTIRLIQGYDESVSFSLDGDGSERFALTQTGENSISLSFAEGGIEQIENFSHFVFSVVASKTGSVSGEAAIVIYNTDLIGPTVMQFAKNTYTGNLENNLLTLESIVLETGFAEGTQFLLSGEFASYFTHTTANNIVSLTITSELPAEVFENNKFIVLELEARRDGAVSAFTSIVIEIFGEIVVPVFGQAYYTGMYTEENTLQFLETITLLQGYDETVTFGLEGESALWFDVTQNGNSASIVSTSPVPQDILDIHNQLLFSVVAYKPNTINGFAAIAIELPNDVLEREVLRFTQSSYEGQLDGSELQMPTISLSNQITQNVLVSLSGDYATYFTVTFDTNVVHLELTTNLPAEVISLNDFIVIDIIASRPDAVSGYTALVLNIVKDPSISTPVFEQAYYTGEISEQGGLVFDHTIRLIQGYDESVTFILDGDGSERFILTQSGQNSLSLSAAEGVMDQIENISHLVFSVVARKTGSISGEAAIVIHNTDSSTARALRFSQNYYKGSLEESDLTVESIGFVEGYSPDVELALIGDYADYFQLVGQGATYTLQLVTNIPSEVIEINNVLIFSLEATVDETRAYATVIIELIKNDNTEINALTFDEAYYIGTYSAATGNMPDINVHVATGYDSATEFTIEEEIGALFNVVHANSIVMITLVAPLPAELFINNQPVIFSLRAINSVGNTASATIVVTLEDELSELTVLGFERNNYLGTIEGAASTLQPISLNQGYSPEVHFTLQGDLASYFTIVQEYSTVNVVLQNAIPEQAIPVNNIIVLELQATAVQAISASATIVFDVVKEEFSELVFNAPYYVGQYRETEGLEFDHVISLEVGYDENVQFLLEGEHAQWFALQIQDNSVTLTLLNAIPPAIIVNNHQLVFHVIAEKPNSNFARATIVVSLVEDYTDAIILGFERSSYLGTINDDVLSIEPIVLNEGYSDAVTFTLHGELASYFSLQQQDSTVNIVLLSVIPEQALPANGIVILEVGASREQAIPATTTIVIDTHRPVTGEEVVFSATHYIGQYSETNGLEFNAVISLAEGFDEHVEFALEGEHAQWFTLQGQDNSITLTLSGAIPPAILENNHQLIFFVTAQKPNSNIARAAIVISLVEDYTDAIVLGFERSSYLGTIDDDVLSIVPIVLNEGYSDAVTFTLHGELASYFSLQQQDYTVNIVLLSVIPEQALPANGIVILEVRASREQAIPATTTVVIDTHRTVTGEEVVFSATHYIGQYSETNGLEFNAVISLAEGFDEHVEFALEGEHAQWFTLQGQDNSITLTLSGAIPPAILVNNHQLVFFVTAQKPNSNIARATIVISLVEDYTDAIILGFERSSYLGTIDDDVLSIEPIVLNEGYSDAVTFTLHGEMASYFSLQQQDSTVNIVLQSVIPEQALPANGIVILEVRASREQAIPATTTVVIDTHRTVTGEEVVFSATHYIGQYSETNGLEFNAVISLAEGFDEHVEFALEGEHAQWFTLQGQDNSMTLTLSGAIPPAILVNNHQLVFFVTAQKPNSNIARATIVISLVEDYTDAIILGFERSSYLGTIDDDVLSIEPIVLNEGYSDAVTFTLHGELASYFSLQQQDSTVNIVLQSVIPEQALPANGIVILEVRASREQAIPATTTVVIDTHRSFTGEEVIFSATHYIGLYSETNGLEFNAVISLAEGFDEHVEFALEGEHAQWFTLQGQDNSMTLTLSGAIPPAILVNNHQLVFFVTAQKPNSNIARATIVISLVEDYTDAIILGFERSSYLGTIDDDVLSIEPIVLNEGYSDAVTFTLHGELASYFSLQQQDSTVNIVLQSVIPEQALPANGIVILEVRASREQAIPATTTVVIDTHRSFTWEEVIFSATHYIGLYSETNGLEFNAVISLAEGFDEHVEFALEGEHAQWFTLQGQDNSITLTLSGAIPPAILVNNHQLIFFVTAQKPNSNIARAAIVISLVEDYTDAIVLGFERSSYLGTIDDDVLSIEPIVLNEGYSDAVTFTLHGELASYFSLQQQDSTVNIVLQSVIPEQALPANGIVILEVRASREQAIPATTTVVIDTHRSFTGEEVIFSATHYIGLYSETNGLEFNAVISLAEGFDEHVEFALEGEHAQWFTLQGQDNSITLTLSGAIPPAILVNNHQLIFFVTAQKPNSNIARAAIVISLVEDYTDAIVLGFERSSYLGTIDDDVLSIVPIVLNEGYSDAVTFTLHGELASYFSLQQQDYTVNIVLLSVIPEQALPANGIVILEVRASREQAIPATTTVVIDTHRTVTGEEVVFSATHYIGQYSETNGLEFNAVISLAEGFDEHVEFALEGEHAQWFTLQGQDNSITLTLSGAIPPAILVNNHQLVFFVTAQKPNSNIARATIVISLVEDYTDAIILGFERSSYLGTIDDDVLSIEPIVLNEGYSDAVTFTLHGEMASYFSLQQQDSTVNIVLQSVIPEQALPANGIVILEVRASREQAIPATTTVVIDTHRTVTGEEVVFSATHYIGQYSETNGLEFNAVISLAEGFDEHVEFALEGEHAQWFTLQGQDNSMTLTLSGAIPPAILVNNHQLVFFVTAQKPNSNIARATIVISLVEDYTDAIILGFERSSYLGTIDDDVLSIEPIVLNEGYSDAVTFTLHGELASYFSLQQQDSTVNIVLQSVIPEQALPANGIVILEVRASREQAIPATTTVVIDTHRSFTGEEVIFSATHYIGLYSETNGLEFNAVISLAEGFDEHVEFALEGEHAQWFTLQGQDNSMTLTLSGAIPPAILVNNHQLVFFVTAQKPNSNIARATIVISLVEDYTDAIILGFERSSYLGTIDDDVLSIEPIVLNEGYSDAVTFTLHGELASYFSLQQQDSTVNIVLQSVIPEQALPANGIVILEVRASREQAIPATTTVVIDTHRSFTWEEVIFSATHYIGLYSETNGLEFNAVISLAEGFDEHVEFALEGEHAQWFTLQGQDNSITLTLSGAIPPAILVNNHQLIFFVTAQKPNSNIARAAIVISLVEDYTDAIVLGFERSSYLGTIDDDVLSIEPIVLNEGYSDAVTFTLHGELASYFSLQQQDSTVNIVLQSVIPEQALPANGIVILEVRASREQAIPATTTVVIDTHRSFTGEEVIFSATHYIGLYSETNGLEFNAVISLAEGFDEHVEFALEGEHAQWFTLQGQDNSITLTLSGAIPPAILVNNHQLIFFVTAQKPNSNIARAAIVISLVEDYTDAIVLGFERSSYLGTIDDDVLSIEPIVLNEGYSDAVTFTLHGELASYFSLQQQDSTVNIVLLSVIPEQALPANGIVILEVRASREQAIPATTTVVIITHRSVTGEEVIFSATHYIGQYSETNGLEFNAVISLAEGFDEHVEFALEGEHAQWFGLQVQDNSATLIMTDPIPPAILVNNHQLVFIVVAQKPNSNTARATVVISLVEDYTSAIVLGFERSSYLGSIENNVLSIEPIVLNEGYSDAVTFTLHGDFASYFDLQQQDSTVIIVLQIPISEQALPTNGILILNVRASAPDAIPSTTTVIVEAQKAAAGEALSFGEAYYTGEYSDTGGLEFDIIMSVDAIYDNDVEFTLEGDYAQYFALSYNGNSVTLHAYEPIPPTVLMDQRKIIMIVNGIRPGHNTARTIIVLSITNNSGSVPNEYFDKILYEGTINLNVVQHEPITITGYTGSDIEILGVYRDLFSATVSEGTVVVGAPGTLGLPEDTTHVALELRAGDASAVLILNVIQSETPELPTVTFGSPSYVLRADMTQTGLVGQVQATASNGETITYSLAINNAHLQERVSINNNGEINLSAPTSTGVYNFQVLATSAITQVQAAATVQLTVEAAAPCGDDHTLPPLIILDRDEEESHANLVVLDSVAQAGCQFRLTNRWPLDQDWLYVDETGLHARSIDREDPRIAFMALSQIQVELVLECASDAQSRVKRSTTPRLDWLGPYEYGSYKWILSDTILYNSRRSFVNLIVNDINDNYPIFVGMENEPIVCGYPIPELEEIILPRALTKLKATDADVGENAALSFWSSEDVLAVSPATGSVHVRDGAILTHDQLLTVSVTDLNGREDGLTGTIQLLVKLVDTSNIAVVTVRNAFLDQEETILSNLSSAVGYEVKVLSSAVISDDPADSENARSKREATGQGASLQLYVYGVIDREPVAVDRLTNDITEHQLAGVDVTRTVSLEDYLEGREISGGSGRETGLLVATIVLSVLLFILIVAIAIWFFLRWRKARNYEQFSDANSVGSRTEPLEEPAKLDTLNKPRLNIDELKRSERRLQEMLDAPIDEPKAQTSKADPAEAFDTIINIAPTDTTLPIVIQSIDKLKDDANSEDEDEYGERKKDRRKSVVTFNEHVEKIIHVEDIPDDRSSEVEIFKF